MDLLWDTKENDTIDILRQTTWKAILTTDGSYSIIVDHDDSRKKKEVCMKNLPDIDYEKTDWFTILFSPNGVICDLKFMYAEPSEKQQMIQSIQNFRTTFFLFSIEQEEEKGEPVRAEAINRLWKSFKGNKVMRPLSRNDREVQKLLDQVKEQNVNQIDDFEAGIYDLIIKYTIQLVLYEQSLGPKALRNLAKHKLSNNYYNSNNRSKTAKKTAEEEILSSYLSTDKVIEKRFKDYNRKYINVMEIVEQTKDMHRIIYEELHLGDIEEDTQEFFYQSYKCRGKTELSKKKEMQITILALLEIFLYFYVFDLSDDPKKALARFSLGNGVIHEKDEYYADMSWFIIDQASTSVEIVLYVLLELNRILDNTRDFSFQTFQSVFDRLQVRILPYLRAKTMEASVFKSVWREQAEQMWKRLKSADGYALLGEFVFHGAEDTEDTKTEDNNSEDTADTKTEDNNSEDTDSTKSRARDYWKKRKEHGPKGTFEKNKSEILQDKLTPKETLIADRFQTYISIQQKNLNTWNAKQQHRYAKNIHDYIAETM